MSLVWENLTIGFSEKRPLNQAFSGTIEKPGFYAIKGPNGSGKSTLLRTWLGLEKPLSGSVTFSGSIPNSCQQFFSEVRFVPQFHKVNHFFPITVYNFITMGLGHGAYRKQFSPSRMSQLLKDWQLDEFKNQNFHTLSGGQKTRALVARALISSPKYVFLDEPLASLDSCCQALLMETLHILTHEQNVVAIMIDHHFGGFEHFLSQTIEFCRTHNNEVCSIKLQFNEHKCKQ